MVRRIHIVLLFALVFLQGCITYPQTKQNTNNQKHQGNSGGGFSGDHSAQGGESGSRGQRPSGDYRKGNSNATNILLGLINDYRQQNGLQPLDYNPNLEITDDQTHSAFMRSGIPGVSNWASPTDPYQVFEMWKNSPGHNQNMLAPNISTAGIDWGNGATFVGGMG